MAHNHIKRQRIPSLTMPFGTDSRYVGGNGLYCPDPLRALDDTYPDGIAGTGLQDGTNVPMPVILRRQLVHPSDFIKKDEIHGSPVRISADGTAVSKKAATASSDNLSTPRSRCRIRPSIVLRRTWAMAP